MIKESPVLDKEIVLTLHTRGGGWRFHDYKEKAMLIYYIPDVALVRFKCHLIFG